MEEKMEWWINWTNWLIIEWTNQLDKFHQIPTSCWLARGSQRLRLAFASHGFRGLWLWPVLQSQPAWPLASFGDLKRQWGRRQRALRKWWSPTIDFKCFLFEATVQRINDRSCFTDVSPHAAKILQRSKTQAPEIFWARPEVSTSKAKTSSACVHWTET